MAAEPSPRSRPGRLQRLARPLRLAVGIGAAVLLAMQVVPYGRDHTNPRVAADAPWPSEQAASIARAACYDCHSNETDWPWYSNIAPTSWLVASDVADGRVALNFSEWPRDAHQVEDSIDMVEDGQMPPRQYLMLHADARLSDAEKHILLDALRALEGGDRDTGDRSGSNSGKG